MEPSSMSTQTTQTPPVTQTLERIPREWPGMFGLYKYSKQAVKVNLWTIIELFALDIVISFASGIFLRRFNGFSILVTAPISAALIITLLAGVRGGKVSLNDALAKGVTFWLKLILLELLVGASYLVSFALLIVPFFFVLPRLTLAAYFLVDKNMGVIEAYKASWHATKGHALKVWSIFLASSIMALLILTIIGIPFAIYFLLMYSAALAVLYQMIQTIPVATAKPASPPSSLPEQS